jgi:large repetitive protein
VGAVSYAVTGGSLPTGSLSLSSAGQFSGTPNGTAGVSSFTVTATDTAGGGLANHTATALLSIQVDDPSAANPCLANALPHGSEGMLNGPYAIFLQGFNGSGAPGTPVALAGSFVANGTGGITGGSVDLSNSSGHQLLTISNISTAYTVGSNGQGCVTLTFPGPTTATFHFVLGGVNANGAPVNVASAGRIIEFDDYSGSGNHTSGVLRRQDTTVFSPSDTANLQSRFAFGLDGVDFNKGHIAEAGSISLNPSTGLLSSGVFDVDDAGFVQTNISGVTGSITGVSSSTGRALLSTNSTVGPFNGAIYIVNANEFFIVGIDTFSSSVPILSGRAIKTAALNTYTASTPAGSYIFHETGIDLNSGGSSCSSSTPCAVAQIGIVTLTSGTSTLSGTSTSFEAGSSSSDSFSATYTVDSASGRITISGAGSGAPVFYIATPVLSGSGATEPISVFFVESDSSASLGIGEPQPQPVTYGPGSLSGNFMFAGEDSGQNASFTNIVGQGSVSGGTGALVGNRDRSGPGGLFLSAPVTLNFAVSSDGTVTGIVTTSAIGATNGTKLFEAAPTGTPAAIRTFEQQ